MLNVENWSQTSESGMLLELQKLVKHKLKKNEFPALDSMDLKDFEILDQILSTLNSLVIKYENKHLLHQILLDVLDAAETFSTSVSHLDDDFEMHMLNVQTLIEDIHDTQRHIHNITKVESEE
ncbi:MAG: hypothetical protein R1F52_07680 [Candidatus Nitrosoabyssus spongiisocia]|nr:MAG: hypothetical protein R1F52_07680 [Nitrosopumilaceae archaeon AB1(1)]